MPKLPNSSAPKKVSVFMPADLHEAAKAEARRQMISLSALVRITLKARLDRVENVNNSNSNNAHRGVEEN